MAFSALTGFAKFLHQHDYSTRMWENGYGGNDANGVCHELTEWGQRELNLPGEFIMLWSRRDDVHFGGDSELAYALNGTAYLVPNPFIEGDPEGFVQALQHIAVGTLDELYQTEITARILYNAV